MQDKDTTKSTFYQLFKPVCSTRFCQQLKDSGVDKYIKKLNTVQLIELTAHAQLKQHEGLRDISNSLNQDEFSQAIGLDSISASQLSRRLRELPPKIVQSLFKSIVFELGKKIGFNTISKNLGRLYLIDSSTISLCLSNYRWAEFRQTKSGIKLHLRLKFLGEEFVPDKAIITPAKPADRTQMDALVVEEDALNVYDRAYVDYKKFDDYCTNGTRFVTRLKGNAKIEVIAELPVKPKSPIKRHQIVYLGTKGINRMQHPLKLIETEDTKGNLVRIVTNDFDLSPDEISDIYRYRWQIELFFKWIKQHFHVKHFYGTSQQAVENQLLIALTTYCLLVLFKFETGYKGTLLDIKRLLDTCLFDSFTVFVKKLYPQAKRKSKGRRKTNHELIFQYTLRQVIAGEADHLDDLTYDPLI